MTANAPNPERRNNWDRAASNPLPKGLMMKVTAFGAVLAIALFGWIVWSVFDGLGRITNEAEKLAAAAKIDTHCDAGETPAKAGGPMSEGKCIADEFRVVIVDRSAAGQ